MLFIKLISWVNWIGPSDITFDKNKKSDDSLKLFERRETLQLKINDKKYPPVSIEFPCSSKI